MNLRDLDAAFIFGFVAVVCVIVALWLMGGCTLHNPPPCDPSSSWPDPCFTKTITDAAPER